MLPAPTSGCSRVYYCLYIHTVSIVRPLGHKCGVGVIRRRIQTKLGQMSWTAMTLSYCMYFVHLFGSVISDSTW